MRIMPYVITGKRQRGLVSRMGSSMSFLPSIKSASLYDLMVRQQAKEFRL